MTVTPQATARPASDFSQRTRERVHDRGARTLLITRALLVGAMVFQVVFILTITRDQWFETDALQYIVTRGGDPDRDMGLLQPYGGHWQVLPILLFRALFVLAGGTYWPYVLMALTIHCLLCGVAFELLRRLRTTPWVALATVWVLLFYGQGADVYMSDAPFPLSLATLISFTAALVLERTTYSRRGCVAAAVLLLLAIMTSGAGIAGAVMVAGLAVARSRWRIGALVIAPAAITFVTWYVTYGRDGGRVRPLGQSLLEIPEWLWIGLPGALERAVGVPNSGVLILMVVIGAVAFGSQPSPLRRAAAVGLVTAGSQMTLSAIGAIVMGPETALTGRYTYLSMAFLLPAVAATLTEAWTRLRVAKAGRWVAPFAVAVVLVPVTANAVARQLDQADGRRLFSGVYYDWVQGAIAGVEADERILTTTPDEGFNGNVDIAVLTSDRLLPRLKVADVSSMTRLNAENRFMVYVGAQDQDLFSPAFTATSGFTTAAPTGPGCNPLTAMLLQDQLVKIVTGAEGNQFGMTSASTKITTRLRRGDMVSNPTTWDVEDGPVFVASTAKDAVLEVLFDADGDYTFCHQ